MRANLLSDFYAETASNFNEENTANFTVAISLNPEHPIYKGHFEQIPIVPGVCQFQIIKELVMAKFQVNLILTESDSIKYLGMINPLINSELLVTLNVIQSATEMSVNASISFEKTIFTKFKGKFALV